MAIFKPCKGFRALCVSAVCGGVPSQEVKRKCADMACSGPGYSIVFSVVDKVS